MKLRAFSIFDEKAKVFSNPFFMTHEGLALRAFQDLIKDEKTTIAQHPSDFKLYLLGEFDDNSGFLKALDIPEFMVNAIDYKKAPVVSEPE